ncbi:recombinase RecT [Methylobacterium nodulans]|uniref:RecT protein n=1 Tax=Methylobacterium nodulans (strain LMG 21967 / CNCM I-2342 / ORS 2060) TaxID=460265 RepID=B8IAP3_METNO|nr:recombinase RecT [Methylobacterium nodulans]ACL61088.1 conserved hypothetical protein [Methylobacterium nodulans ORS 2060]
MTAGALTLSDAERKVAERIDLAGTTALAVSAERGGIAFANAEQLMNFAKLMAVSNAGVRKHLRGNPGACLAIVTQAVEWGLSPYAVANKSYFVNDQIAYESQLVQAVILKRAPIKGRIRFEYTGEGDSRVCRAWARLADEPDEIVEYVSPSLAKITPKNSPLWKTDPDQQLSYYCGRALCRRHFPDVLLGVYAEDEIEAIPARGPEMARDVTPRGLGAKLDALAAGPKASPPRPAAEVVEAFDPPPVERHDADADPGSDDDDFPGDTPVTPVAEREPGADEETDEEDGEEKFLGDPEHPDFQAGALAKRRGHRRRCLNQSIAGDPERLSRWYAGYDSAPATDGEG